MRHDGADGWSRRWNWSARPTRTAPTTGRAFFAKCAGLLRAGVAVTIVDVVTTRESNLHGELLDFLGMVDPAFAEGSPPLYAASCRWSKPRVTWLMETWAYPLELGRALPTLPIWLAPGLAVPLDLEASYEETCKALRIP